MTSGSSLAEAAERDWSGDCVTEGAPIGSILLELESESGRLEMSLSMKDTGPAGGSVGCGGGVRRRLRLVALAGCDHALVPLHTWHGFRDGLAGSSAAFYLPKFFVPR